MTPTTPPDLDYFDERACPDLQRLVAIFGRYNRIPQSAWTRWDHDVAARAANLPPGIPHLLDRHQICALANRTYPHALADDAPRRISAGAYQQRQKFLGFVGGHGLAEQSADPEIQRR